MPPSIRFYQIDVFTQAPFCGNPLAVFPFAEDLDERLMQKIAREMNLSETTFVTGSATPDGVFPVRIFTPTKEIPFGGHPTLGTAEIFKHAGLIEPTATRVTLGMGVGPVIVEWLNGACFMGQPLPEFTPPTPGHPSVHTALGLSPGDIHPTLPVQQVSTGFPALIVPLANPGALGKITLNLGVLREVLGDLDLIYPFYCQAGNPELNVQARSFAPFIGIQEDPATGSVAGALGAYLLHHNVFGGDSLKIKIVQGVEMGRPSEITVEITRNQGEITSVRVGGHSCLVMAGELYLG